ncbi:hypothetical protein, conserved in P.knowlesi [Plasmodium knowlesi strain H]|uniref:Uncharacterized protein n=3 Tax=Plasmodium knowlesi TaxID=5850 RepID=A0A5E7X5L0_PLAKH|nr:hypothetical protein, conserved in P.knowlesi [Plasmodium knowlesi strain H]OTN66793.1 Uncharacterized protein PKNOH_S08471800 [Plasmodium knowlesi]CAA9990043.1 hypothetical protein, conserved in P.knowlesi [Plasmodium knowlesi strain H]SBO25698.1 hypothetical protein, conserved in P.knowlesi [Plasmodium knowlesi strain H]SBO28515.1 hypothetical protein, conserved in P.knowlesi [Plasmodium knowlesi strain H]VVS79517.1 hypothetical protein, conserved in P.knowlesi [Plasmodium knowlesi strain
MAPFSFIKISTLIFAYLFLWYQTNDQHQVSALSTLKDDDDVSVGNGLYSSEEDINNGNSRLKTLQSDGTNDSPSSHQEESDDNDVSTLLGSIDNELLEHALSGQTPSSAKRRENSSKGIGTKIKESCKKLTHYKNKNKILLIVILITLALYPLTLSYASRTGYILMQTVSSEYMHYVILVVTTIMGLNYLGILFWFLSFQSLD